MTDNITMALALLLTIPLWILYHRIFSVYYHGNVASAIVKELVGAFCTGLFLSILLVNLFGSVLALLLRLCLFLLAVLLVAFLIFLIQNRLPILIEGNIPALQVRKTREACSNGLSYLFWSWAYTLHRCRLIIWIFLILIAGGIITSLISGVQTPDAPAGGSDPDPEAALPAETPYTMVLEPTPTPQETVEPYFPNLRTGWYLSADSMPDELIAVAVTEDEPGYYQATVQLWQPYLGINDILREFERSFTVPLTEVDGVLKGTSDQNTDLVTFWVGEAGDLQTGEIETLDREGLVQCRIISLNESDQAEIESMYEAMTEHWQAEVPTPLPTPTLSQDEALSYQSEYTSN